MKKYILMSAVVVLILVCSLLTFAGGDAPSNSLGSLSITHEDSTPYNLVNSAGIYSKQAITPNFKVYFKNNSNTANAVRFEKDGYYFTYDISDGTIMWKEKSGQPSQSSTLGSGYDSNSKNTLVSASGNQAIYSNAFEFTNVTYDVTGSMLKENFILSNITSGIKDYLYLEYTGNIEFNKTLKICANNQCYPPSGTNDDFTTQEQIDFKNSSNDTIFYLQAPVATDSAGNKVNLTYIVHGSDAKMKFYLRIPTTFLLTAVYPIFLDPTVVTTDQLISQVTYQIDDIITSFILKKFNGTAYNIEPSSIWIKNQTECAKSGKLGLCFGATDSANLGLANYSYAINSNSKLNLIEVPVYNNIYNRTSKQRDRVLQYKYPIFYTYTLTNSWQEDRQEYNFKDICQKSYAKCSWTSTNTSAIVNFISDKNIDPSITNVSGCGYINSAGSYALNQSISGLSDCITINSSNVNLNGNGFTVNRTAFEAVAPTWIIAYENNSVGDVISVSLFNEGRGYEINDEIYIDGCTSGSGAVAVVDSVDGRGGVTAMTVTSSGMGYYGTDYCTTTTNGDGFDLAVYIIHAGSSGAYHFVGYSGDLIYYEIRPYKTSGGTKYFTSSGAYGSLYSNGEYDAGSSYIQWNSATGDFDGYRITMDDVTGGYFGCGYTGNYYHDIANNVDTNYLDNVGCGNWVNTECVAGNCYPNIAGGISSGIITSGFNNLTISNITLTGFSYGLWLQSSSNNQLSTITANSNTNFGIALSSSSNNTLSNITANTNIYGLYLFSSSNNTLSNINSNSNTNYGLWLQSSSKNTLSNINSNSNTNYGLCIEASSNNNLTNITANTNIYGLYLSPSSNNNQLSNINSNSNTNYGIYLSASSNNNLTNITANSNTLYGILMQTNANKNNITNTITNNNKNAGIAISSASNNTVSNATTNNNTNYGIVIATGSNNIITNINANSNRLNGVLFSSTLNNIVSQGIINGTIKSAITFTGTTATNNTIINISITNTNISWFDLHFNTASVNGTWLIDMPYIGNYNVSGTLNIKKTGLGQIAFTNAISGIGTNLSNDIQIGNNSVYVNSTKTGLNKSANITLYGIGDRGFPSPAILQDGVSCPLMADNITRNCINYTSLTADTVIFNVASWSNYSIGNGTIFYAVPIIPVILPGGGAAPQVNNVMTTNVTTPALSTIPTPEFLSFIYSQTKAIIDWIIYHLMPTNHTLGMILLIFLIVIAAFLIDKIRVRG